MNDGLTGEGRTALMTRITNIYPQAVYRLKSGCYIGAMSFAQLSDAIADKILAARKN